MFKKHSKRLSGVRVFGGIGPEMRLQCDRHLFRFTKILSLIKLKDAFDDTDT